MSFFRSTIVMNPSRSTVARSPLWNQPPANAVAVVVSSFR